MVNFIMSQAVGNGQVVRLWQRDHYVYELVVGSICVRLNMPYEEALDVFAKECDYRDRMVA